MNTHRRENLTDYTNDSLRSFKSLTLLDPEEVKYAEKMNTVLRFMKAKRDFPYMKKKELCDSIGISDSSFQRLSKDLGIGSFYKHKVKVNRKTINSGDDIDSIINKLNSTKIKNIDVKRKVIFQILNKGKSGSEIKTSFKGFEIRSFLENDTSKINVFKNILSYNKTPTEKVDEDDIEINEESGSGSSAQDVPNKKRKLENTLMEINGDK